MTDKRKNFRSFIALLLCLMMLIGTVAGCSGKQDDAVIEQGAYEEMDRFQEENAVHTAYRSDGSYTVTFAEGNLFYGEDEPGSVKLDIDRKLTLDAVTQDDLAVVYAYEVRETAQEEPVSASDDYVIDDYRNAQITSFSNDGGIITVSFVDPDVAVNHTDSYMLYIERMAAGAVLTVDFEDHSLKCGVDQLYSNIDGVQLDITVAEGDFSEDISADDISLGGSFAEMKIENIAADGYKLALALAGEPCFNEEMNFFMPGEIIISPNGFENGYACESLYIEMDIPTVGVKADELRIDGNTAVVPVSLAGIDASEITADDISFESGAQVAGVQADGDRLLVTVKADEADDLAGQITVGDLTVTSSVTHAAFYPFFDFIAQDGDDLEMSLILEVSAGTVSDGITPEMVTLSGDFESGKVLSINKTDDITAELIISVPANGQTDEEYDLTGIVTLAEGALVDTWGDAAPEYAYTRRYVPDELGRDTVTTAIDYSVKGLGFVGVDAKEVGAYSKAIYELVKSGEKLDPAGIYKGVKQILTLAGVFSGGDNNLAPNKTVAQQVEEVKNLINAMDKKLDKVVTLLYHDLLQPYDNALKTLDSDCEQAQMRIDKAIELMRERGMEIPQENASDEELMEFNAKLIQLMEDEEKAGNGDFKNFTYSLLRIEDNFILLTNGLTNEKETNILTYYDDMWTTYFNWDSQSAYMRQAYRTNCEFAVKRAYNMLAIYYQIPKYPDTYKRFTEAFAKSLDIAGKPIEFPDLYGPPSTDKPFLYSYSLKTRLTNYTDFSYTDITLYGTDGMYVKIPDEDGKEYVSRLHGNSVKEDLRFAVDNDFVKIRLTDFDHKDTIGIGLRGEWGKSKWRIKHMGKVKVWNERVLKWDKSISTVNTYDPDYEDEDRMYLSIANKGMWGTKLV